MRCLSSLNSVSLSLRNSRERNTRRSLDSLFLCIISTRQIQLNPILGALSLSEGTNYNLSDLAFDGPIRSGSIFSSLLSIWVCINFPNCDDWLIVPDLVFICSSAFLLFWPRFSSELMGIRVLLSLFDIRDLNFDG